LLNRRAMKSATVAVVIAIAWPAAAKTHAPLVAAEPRPAPVAAGELPGSKEFVGCQRYPETKKFRWSVRGEVGVPELIASLGEIGCVEIIAGPQVLSHAGKVVMEVPDLLTAPEVYRLFYSALDSLGFTVEKSGATLKVVDSGRAKDISQLHLGAEPVPLGDQYVTRLVRLRYARPQELGELLGKLKSKEGDVTVYAPGSALMITDRATNVRRMEELARSLDVERPGERMWVLGTHAQSATELAATVEKILQASRREPGDAKAPASAAAGPLADGVAAVVPVDAARLLVVVASEDGFRHVLQLAARIDPPIADEAGGQAHVIYLANTNAEEMAQTLQSLGLSSRSAAAPTGPRPAGLSGSSSFSSSSTSSGGLGLQGEVRVAPDKVSNAIVVFAGAADFLMVRDLINKLDVPRRQVYVEAAVLDVSVDRTRNLGLAFHGTEPIAGATGFIAQGASGLNSISVNATSLAGMLGSGGLLAGILGPSLSVAGMSIPSVGVILQALEHSKDVSVLSRPHLLTMDNIKASLSVGQSIPFPTQSLTAATSAVPSIINSYQRQDVVLRMDLTPHLNDSDAVRLEIDGEISDVPDGQTGQLQGGPITNKRTIKTAIVVHDGETVVLGGLQKESESEAIEKIPGLGDIPLLGRLFQMRSKQRTKQDLLIVLTPYVIRGPEDLRRIYEQKQEDEREFLERYTAFHDESRFESRVDYKRKRGLLQEINLVALEAEHEAVAMRRAEKALKRPVSPDGEEIAPGAAFHP
jgi:general secretion pathway protein D